MAEETIREYERLRTELLEMTPKLKALLKADLEEVYKDIAKSNIRRKYGYFIPDFILRIFYSEFKENVETHSLEETANA